MKWYEWGALSLLAVFFAGNIVMGAVGTEYNSGPLGFGTLSGVGGKATATRPRDRAIMEGFSGARVEVIPGSKKIRIKGGGHVIKDAAGNSKPLRPFLRFSSPLQVTDNAGGDETRVSIPLHIVGSSSELTSKLSNLGTNGGTIFLLPGTYSGKFTVQSNISLVGPGVKTILKLPDSDAGTGIVLNLAGDNITVENILVDGNKAGQTTWSESRHGIYASGRTGLKIVRTEVKNTTGIGIQFVNCVSSTIDTSYVHDTATVTEFPAATNNPGIWVGGASTSGVEVVNTNSLSNGLDGLIIDGPNVKVIGGTYSGNGVGMTSVGAAGIYSPPSAYTNVTIQGVHANNNTGLGIDMWGIDEIHVTGCITVGNNAAGIALNSCTGGSASNNTSYNNGTGAAGFPPVHDYQDAGISIYDCSNVTVSSNRAYDSQGSPTQKYGVYFGGGTINSLLIDNDAWGNSGTNTYTTGMGDGNITKIVNSNTRTMLNFRNISTALASDSYTTTNSAVVNTSDNHTKVVSAGQNTVQLVGSGGADVSELRAFVNQAYNNGPTNITGNVQANVSAGGCLSTGDIANLFLFRAETFSPGGGNIDNVYSYYSNPSSGNATNRYHFYGLGNYPSYFGGLVESAAGGFKFPDGTTQATAVSTFNYNRTANISDITDRQQIAGDLNGIVRTVNAGSYVLIQDIGAANDTVLLHNTHSSAVTATTSGSVTLNGGAGSVSIPATSWMWLICTGANTWISTTAFSSGGVTDHGALTGLTDDDHSGAPWLAGRSGGQTQYGGTAAADDYTVVATSGNAASTGQGNIVFKTGNNGGTTAATIDFNGRLGLMAATTPSAAIHVDGSTTADYIRLINRSASGSGGGSGLLIYSDDGAAVATDDRLAFFLGGGARDASGNLGAGGGMQIHAEAAYATGSYPTYIDFLTTAASSTTRTPRFRIGSTGVQTTNQLTARTSASKVLTNDTSTSVMDITLADEEMICGWIEYCAHSTDGTDMVIHRGRVSFAATSKGGVQTADIAHNHETGTSNVATGGATYTDAVSGAADLANAGGWGIQSGTGKITLKYRGNASVTTTGYPMLKYTINLQGTNTMTPL